MNAKCFSHARFNYFTKFDENSEQALLLNNCCQLFISRKHNKTLVMATLVKCWIQCANYLTIYLELLCKRFQDFHDLTHEAKTKHAFYIILNVRYLLYKFIKSIFQIQSNSFLHYVFKLPLQLMSMLISSNTHR